MIYCETSNLLLRLGFNLGRPARTYEDPTANVTGLFVDPVGWFIVLKDTGELDLGRYRAEDLRLVEARSISLDQVTPKLIVDKLDLVLIEFVGWSIGQSVRPQTRFSLNQSNDNRRPHEIPFALS